VLRLPTCSSPSRECSLLYLPGGAGIKHLLATLVPETGDEQWLKEVDTNRRSRERPSL
jgi:hypothetical protein